MTNSNNHYSVFHRSAFAMNTQLDVVLWGGGQSTFELAFQQMTSEVEGLELTLSRYNLNSELYNLNQLAFPQPVDVSKKLMTFIELASMYDQNTNGYFDVSLGTLFHQLKNGEMIEYATNERFSNRVSIDLTNRTVQFLQPNRSFDFGGMGKGIALKTMAKIVDHLGIENVFISFGGSSVLTRGRHPHGEYWPFTLAEHQEKSWQLNNDCLSISSLERKAQGTTAKHILNPFHDEQTTSQTVVVQSANPVEAEVLSTTLIAAPEAKHLEILQNFDLAKHFIFKTKIESKP